MADEISGKSGRDWLRALSDLLFPPGCLACGRPLATSLPPLFCTDCRESAPFIQRPLCSCCGAPFLVGMSHPCGLCLASPPAFALARAAFVYASPIREGVLALKFQHDLAWLPTLAALCRESALLADLSEPDWLIPVPLHPKRLRERGFNQSLLLARRCFPEWQRKLAPELLQRVQATVAQSTLDGATRRLNVKRAFFAPDPARLAGKSALLVDDVMTTGATVEACCRALRKAGCRRVEVFTLARVVHRLKSGLLPAQSTPSLSKIT